MKIETNRRKVLVVLGSIPVLLALAACGKKQDEGRKSIEEGKYNPFSTPANPEKPKQ